MPVLDITAADLTTPERLAMTRAYLTGLMLWPDDPDRQGEVVAVAAALRISVGADPELALALNAQGRQNRIRNEAQIPLCHGFVAGMYLAGVVSKAEIDGRVKLEAIKAAIDAKRGPPNVPLSKAMLTNTIWPKFRCVGPLWAAHVYEHTYGTDKEMPCRLNRIPDFLAYAEYFRERALALHFPQRKDALFTADEVWRVS